MFLPFGGPEGLRAPITPIVHGLTQPPCPSFAQAQGLTLDALRADKTGLFSLWATHLMVVKEKPAVRGEAKTEHLSWLPLGTAAELMYEKSLDYSNPALYDEAQDKINGYIILVSWVAGGGTKPGRRRCFSTFFSHFPPEFCRSTLLGRVTTSWAI
jgi:hypothetical protein